MAIDDAREQISVRRKLIKDNRLETGPDWSRAYKAGESEAVSRFTHFNKVTTEGENK